MVTKGQVLVAFAVFGGVGPYFDPAVTVATDPAPAIIGLTIIGLYSAYHFRQGMRESATLN